MLAAGWLTRGRVQMQWLQAYHEDDQPQLLAALAGGTAQRQAALYVRL